MIWTYCSCGWIVNVRMTIREMNRLLKPSYGEKGKAVDWRICDFAQIPGQLETKKAAPYRNGAAVEINEGLFLPSAHLGPAGTLGGGNLCTGCSTHFPALASGGL
jgi:hypothetical protein